MYNKLLLFVQANIYFLCNENIILKIFILKITLNDIIINYYYNVVAEVCLTLFHIKGIKKVIGWKYQLQCCVKLSRECNYYNKNI